MAQVLTAPIINLHAESVASKNISTNEKKRNKDKETAPSSSMEGIMFRRSPPLDREGEMTSSHSTASSGASPNGVSVIDTTTEKANALALSGIGLGTTEAQLPATPRLKGNLTTSGYWLVKKETDSEDLVIETIDVILPEDSKSSPRKDAEGSEEAQNTPEKSKIASTNDNDGAIAGTPEKVIEAVHITPKAEAPQTPPLTSSKTIPNDRVSALRNFSPNKRFSFVEPPMPAEKTDRLHRTAKLSHKKNILGETVYKGHPSWLLMRDTQTGLFHNIKDMTKHRMDTSDLFYTPPSIHYNVPGLDGATFEFKDYCSLAFYNLREHYRISHYDYVMSLCQNWSEVGTPGKSGSLFFFSNDNQYVLKTIPKREAKLLRDILPAYYEHMIKNENSLIIRFMGMHRVKPHKGRPVRFLVMVNLFRTSMKIHQRFDLKGSTVGRELKVAERAKKNPTFKDLDFRRLNKKIALGPNREMFLKQIKADAKFLASQNIMDYSLLIGIHYMSEGDSNVDESPPSDDSGLRTPPLNKSVSSLPPVVAPEQVPIPSQLQTPSPEPEKTERPEKRKKSNSFLNFRKTVQLTASDLGKRMSEFGTPRNSAQISSEQRHSVQITSLHTANISLRASAMVGSPQYNSLNSHALQSPTDSVFSASITSPSSSSLYSLDEFSFDSSSSSSSLVDSPRDTWPSPSPRDAPPSPLPSPSPSPRPRLLLPASMSMSVRRSVSTPVDANQIQLLMSRASSSPIADFIDLNRYYKSFPDEALSIWEQDEGGLRGKNPDGTLTDEHYFIGVIDILMLYSARKQFEHAFKSALNPKGEISSVKPDEFSERFVKFVEDIVI